MRKLARLNRILLVAAVVASIGFGMMSTLTEVQARGGGCFCPMVYAPVICDNGKVYSNQCVADCRHAKNCVPLGIFE